MDARQDEEREIADLHRRMVEQVREMEDQIEELNARLQKMRAVVENLQDLYPSLTRYPGTATGGDGPRGQEAVQRVLEQNGGWMGIREITKELRFQRWIDREARDAEAAVRASLRRLEETGGRVEKQKMGRSVLYRVSPADPTGRA